MFLFQFSRTMYTDVLFIFFSIRMCSLWNVYIYIIAFFFNSNVCLLWNVYIHAWSKFATAFHYIVICVCVCMYVLAWSSIAQWVYQQAFSLLANRCLRPWVRILHSAEEDNLSPFDSNIACLCQSIEINNNKHVYRQSQVRKPTGSEVEWTECLLIIGTGCRVQVFSLILDSSVGLSAGIQSAGE